ncbi:MAG: hypothetical protein JXQ90_13890 [Cyclobacteriaceae bacterium]
MKFILTITLALTIHTVMGQESQISFGWGLGNFKKQDLSFSEMIHRDYSPFNVMLGYQKSGNIIQSVDARFGMYESMVSESFTYTDNEDRTFHSYPHSFLMLDINYSLKKEIWSSNSTKVYVGGRVRNRLHIGYYLFADHAGSTNYYFSTGLDAVVSAQQQIGDFHKVGLQVAAPLFSYNARNPYLTWDDEYFEAVSGHSAISSVIGYYQSGSWRSWGSSQIFDMDLDYTYQLSDRLDLGAKYWLSVNLNQIPTYMASINNTLFLVANYKF